MKPELLPEKLRDLLSLLTPNRMVGAGGLAVLSAAAFLSLLPVPSSGPASALQPWLSSLGLNALAGILLQFYNSILALPSAKDIDRLDALTQALAREISSNAELRKELGVFLENLDAITIAEEVTRDNPAVHGMLLWQILQDVNRYHADLTRIELIVNKTQESLLHPSPIAERLFTAPPLPPQGLYGREEDIQMLLEMLRIKDDAQSIPPAALRGMPGIGKTALAIAAAHHPDLKNALPDGVLWTELGPKPTVRMRLQDWGQLLGLDLSPLPDDRACTMRLRDVLSSRQLLIVIDDVWDSRAGSSFLVGGPRSRTILTTRELTIANDLATSTRVLRLDVISPEAAMNVLGALAPEIVAADREGAELLCAKVEYLPLALTLVGRYLANEAVTNRRLSTLVRHLIERADERLALPLFEQRLGIEAGRPSLRAILALSVDRLDPVDRVRFASLSVFGSDPLSWTLEAAAYVWQCNEDEADTTIAHLIQMGLVEPWNRRYRMHTVLADYASVLLEEIEQG